MMTSKPNPRAHEYVANAIAERAASDIRAALRERIMMDVNPEIDAIIEKVLEDLKIESASWRDASSYDNALVANLIITWRGQKP